MTEVFLALGICFIAGLGLLGFCLYTDDKKSNKKVCKDFYERGDR